VFARLPLFNLSITARMLSFASFAFCALAAIGLEQWLADGQRLDRICLLCASLFLALALTTVNSGLSPEFVRVNVARQIVPLLLAFACVRLLPTRDTVAAAFLFLLLVQRTTEARGLVPTLPRRAFYPHVAAFDALHGVSEPFRIVGQDHVLTPATATVYELEDVRGYQAMTFARLVDTFALWSVSQAVWFNRVDDLSSPFLSLMNVRYAFAPDDAVIPPGWRRQEMYPGYQILENTRALPRAFVPAAVHLGAGSKTTVREMVSARDFGEEAWIESPDKRMTLLNGPGQVSTIGRGSGLRLHVNMQRAGWIVVSEAAWKGWQVWEGSRLLELRFADHAFVAFYLTRGRHEISMLYWPRGFVNGALISAATLCFLIAMAVARHVTRLRRFPTSP
jgi:hypothetical protein